MVKERAHQHGYRDHGHEQKLNAFKVLKQQNHQFQQPPPKTARHELTQSTFLGGKRLNGKFSTNHQMPKFKGRNLQPI